MKIILTALFYLLAFSLTGNAQSKEDEAKVLYQKAEEGYLEAVKNYENFPYNPYPATYNLSRAVKDYSETRDYLTKAIGLMGKTPKLLYLLIKVEYDGTGYKAFAQTRDNYNTILQQIEELFSKIDKNSYPQEKANEMITIKLAVQKKLEDPKMANPRTFSSGSDAFNFISETCKKYMVNEAGKPVDSLHISWDGKDKVSILCYATIAGIGTYYYVYSMNISTLQKLPVDEDGNARERSVRINHYYIFPENPDNYKFEYLFYEGGKKPKHVQTPDDLRKQSITGKKNKFDLFLFDNSIPIGTCIDFDNTKFQQDIEADYVKAWEYLYAYSKK